MSEWVLRTNGKKKHASISGAGALHSSQGKNKMKLGLFFTLDTKDNSQWNNLKGKIIIEENRGRYLYDFRVRRNLLNHK